MYAFFQSSDTVPFSNYNWQFGIELEPQHHNVLALVLSGPEALCSYVQVGQQFGYTPPFTKISIGSIVGWTAL